MSLRKRKVIYYIFILIFVIWGSYLIMSTQGIVFDWKEMKMVRTGGIYLKFNPSDSLVFINGEKTEKSTGILNRGIVFDKLLPRTYHVSVRKDSYTPWEKDLNVEEGLFTAASVIKLWPEIPEKNEIATSTTKNIAIVSGGIVEKKDDGKLYSFGNELKGSSIFSSREDSNWIITEDKNKTLFFLNTKNPKTAINVREIFDSLRKRQLQTTENSSIQHALIHPFSDEKVIVVTEQSIYLLDLKKITVEKMTSATSTISRVIEKGNEIFGISVSGQVQGTNLLLLNSFVFDFGIPSLVIDDIKLSESGTKFLFSDKEGKLFLYDRNLNVSKLIAEKIQSFETSPDGTKAIWIDTKKRVSVYYIEKDDGDLKFEKETISLLEIAPGEINKRTKIFWLTGFPSFVFFETSGKIMVSEIDPRGNTLNTATLTESLSNIFATKNNIYIIEEMEDKKIFILSRLKL